ncbi:MAG TPA: response regulator transcription factor [Chitinophagales bacterium]|nr:response regulator transcription factor [Chitinophagales bacterium]
MTTIKIIIADTQYLVRIGLENLLSANKDFKVIGEVSNSKEMLEMVQLHQPEVVIFDYNNPKSFTMDDIAAVKKISPKTNFLIISADENKSNIYKIIELGAISFLTKECDKEEIIGAIYATAKNEKFLCHKVIDIIIEKHMHTDEDNCKAFNLSLRETEIIKLTAKGWNAKTVAGHLFLSTHTVYTHKKNIMKKLNINSSSEMILYAIQNGLVTKEEMMQEN